MRSCIVVLSVVCFSALSFAEKTVAKEDCGAMIREKSAIPAKLSELLSQVSANMEGHAKWMATGKDKASKAEAAVLRKVVAQQRVIAAAAKKLAEYMASVKLEPTPHDMTKADPRMMEQMTRQAKLGDEMAALLRKETAEISKMAKK